MFNTEVTTCYSPITLLRCYGKVLSPFLLRYYAIMARSVLSPSFLLDYYGITQGTSLFFLIGIKATVKACVSSLLRYYGKVLYSSFLLASKLLSESN